MEYEQKAREFVKAAMTNLGFPTKSLCPCTKCHNVRHQLSDEVVEHLVLWGMDQSYKTWFHHGEDPVQSSKTNTSVEYDLFRAARAYSSNENNFGNDNNDANFHNSLEDAESPLYEGCSKYTQISSIVGLYNLKTKHGISDVGFSEILEMIKDMLPGDNVLLASMYVVKKFLKMFDLSYKHIHACVNDCCLYTK